MINPLEIYPLPVLIVDYLLGVVMWTLLARGVLDLFVSPDKNMVMANVFRSVTNPIIGVFKKITPKFLLPLFIPVYVAWWFYMVRFYVIPLIFFGEFGVLSFPLESTIGNMFK